MKKLIIFAVIAAVIVTLMLLPVVFYESGKWRLFSGDDKDGDRVISVGRFYNVILNLFGGKR